MAGPSCGDSHVKGGSTADPEVTKEDLIKEED